MNVFVFDASFVMISMGNVSNVSMILGISEETYDI
jgi:hypothetical protein